MSIRDITDETVDNGLIRHILIYLKKRSNVCNFIEVVQYLALNITMLSTQLLSSIELLSITLQILYPLDRKNFTKGLFCGSLSSGSTMYMLISPSIYFPSVTHFSGKLPHMWAHVSANMLVRSCKEIPYSTRNLLQPHGYLEFR